MQIPLVDLKAQYAEIKDEIDEAVRGVIESAQFINGPNVKSFEASFAKFCGCKRAVGVSSGSSALVVALKAAGIKEGDEVITTANTFIATAEAISQMSAKPVFVDVERETYNMDIEKLRKAITPKTKAIVPVHLYGYPTDMKPLMEIAEKKNLAVIEDCAQAHGTEYKGRRVPVSGIGCFSFFPAKILGCYGDGGGIICNDEEFADRAAALKDHGRMPGEKYIHSLIGYGERLDEIQAAILNAKLKHLDKWIEKRREIAHFYTKSLNGAGVPKEAEKNKHTYYMYVVRHEKRDLLQASLKKEGISTGVHYPVPLHLQPAYSYMRLGEGAFPEAENAAKEILSLPLYPELEREQQEYVIEKVNGFVK
ncbi:DegT/DnrJ/EryC1/StrS family aminotransferase [Candidatus Woesearchaeota archaeon]|nr:DegT/DnrJ/EryC1/StrS family aminotransferase [Candidatus Woesearchaeota archaeon]